jgi:sugar phosphate isomerase/epimerase
MIRAASTYVYVRQRLHPGLLDGLARAGAEAIEIFGARAHFNYHDRAHVRELAAWFKSNSVQLRSLHSPMFYDQEVWGRGAMEPINIVEADRKRQIDAMDEIKRALECAEHMPFHFLVQHLGNGNETFDERKFDAAMTSVEHLRAFAKPLGVKVLLENIPNELSTPEKLVEFVNTAHLDDVGFCFDSGHAHIMSTVLQAFDVMKHNIYSTHLHDNAGIQDSHLWPGEGKIDWSECVSLLRSAHHGVPLLLEIDGENQGDINGKISGAFTFLEKQATVKSI